MQHRALCRTKLLRVTTRFGGHMDVNCWASLQTWNASDDLKWTTITRDTIYTHCWGITDNIYGFGRPCFAPSFVYPSNTRPPIFLRVLNDFYPSKWQVDRSQHKAIVQHLHQWSEHDTETVYTFITILPKSCFKHLLHTLSTIMSTFSEHFRHK